MASHYRDTPLRRFLEFPRQTVAGRVVQTALVRLAAGITRMRGLQPRDEWWVLAPGWQWLRLPIIKVANEIGLIHSSFTLIATAFGADGSGSTVSTVDTSTSLNVAANDVLVDWCKHEGATTSMATAKTTGGNSGTFDAADKVTHSNTDLEAQFGYVLAASADATHTRRLSLGAARSYVSLITHQFRPDASETVSKDASNIGQGNGTAISTGNVTTTGTDAAGVGGYGEYVANVSSSHQINGVAATGVVHTNSIANFTASWYRILSATFTGNASCSNSSGDWVAGIIVLKSVAAGGTTVTPTTASLTTATFAPTVTATNHQTVTPTTKALVLTTFAPTVTASDHKTVTPTTAALVTSAFAPTVAITDHKTVTPITAELVLTTFAPTVTGGGDISVVPSTAALTLTTFAPTVSTTQNVPATTTRRSGGAGHWMPSEKQEKDMALRAQQIREDEELLVLIAAMLPILNKENNDDRRI